MIDLAVLISGAAIAGWIIYRIALAM